MHHMYTYIYTHMCLLYIKMSPWPLYYLELRKEEEFIKKRREIQEG